MTRHQARQRIEKLRKAINHHRYLYHVLDKVEISDDALDSLKHELYELEQQFPALITPDSPTQRVGGVARKEFRKVRHSSVMLSIEDMFGEQEAQEWQDYLGRLAPRDHWTYFAELKIDGLATTLIY